MPNLADRHAGDAGGLIRTTADATPATVVMVVPPEHATRIDVQHTAALTINLLARCVDFVGEVQLDCPTVPLHPKVIPPGISSAQNLDEALFELGAAIGEDGVPIVAKSGQSESAITLVLGPGRATPETWRVHGTGWTGQATRHEIGPTADCALPFGPYVAACLAAAAVCFETRGHTWTNDHMSLSAWHLTSTTSAETPLEPGPPTLATFTVKLILAGLGAVANTYLLTLWATPAIFGEIRGFDYDHVDETNRNRCPIFLRRHDGLSKAEAVNDILGRSSDLSITTENGRVEEGINAETDLVSAVDNPSSREAIQHRYPRSIIQASTQNLRIELLRTDPSSRSACIRCYNPPRHPRSDDAIRSDLAAMDAGEIAAKLGTSDESIRPLIQWRDQGRCSAVAGEMLERFRHHPDEATFSVGFVSAMAGVLLAAQAVKDALAESDHQMSRPPPLAEQLSRASFNLYDLSSKVNGPKRYQRDPSCPACDPNTPAARIWQRRHRR